MKKLLAILVAVGFLLVQTNAISVQAAGDPEDWDDFPVELFIDEG
jgi:hypothetical protein